ncbi:MAG: NmrA family NAD(P)-binding protein [Thermoanaerobaculia bacterium]
MSSNKKKVLLAGATGNLGGRILKELIKRKVPVIALVRKETPKEKISKLKLQGAEVLFTDFQDAKALGLSLKAVSTVISALSGLYDVIIERQANLLDASVIAGVEKFIPSDFSIDFTKFPEGQNRNLDLRRKFHILLDNAPLFSTSIFNGAFMEMLKGQMPLILYKIGKVLYFGNPDQKMDFTSIDNVAEFTVRAALDPKTPRYLRISGDELSAREIAKLATEISGKKFGLFYGGSLKMLSIFIKILKTLNPAKNKLYPAWQGMQYFKNMFEGKCKLEPLDNSRYPEIKWKKVEDILKEKFSK